MYEIVDIALGNRFTELASGSIDVYTTAAPSMGRDLHERRSEVGFTFSIPHLYGGVAYGGNEFFVQCADDLNTQGDCSGLQVCVAPGATYSTDVQLILPAAHIVLLSPDDIGGAFMEGRCNVIIGSNGNLPWS